MLWHSQTTYGAWQINLGCSIKHPFVVALGNGVAEHKFKYYILQDARFLGDLARVVCCRAEGS